MDRLDVESETIRQWLASNVPESEVSFIPNLRKDAVDFVVRLPTGETCRLRVDEDFLDDHPAGTLVTKLEMHGIAQQLVGEKKVSFPRQARRVAEHLVGPYC